MNITYLCWSRGLIRKCCVPCIVNACRYQYHKVCPRIHQRWLNQILVLCILRNLFNPLAWRHYCNIFKNPSFCQLFYLTTLAYSDFKLELDVIMKRGSYKKPDCLYTIGLYKIYILCTIVNINLFLKTLFQNLIKSINMHYIVFFFCARGKRKQNINFRIYRSQNTAQRNFTFRIT